MGKTMVILNGTHAKNLDVIKSMKVHTGKILLSANYVEFFCISCVFKFILGPTPQSGCCSNILSIIPLEGWAKDTTDILAKWLFFDLPFFD